MYDSRSVQVRHSPLHGHGLFARKCFSAGEVILSFDGQTVALSDLSSAFLSAGNWLPLSRTRCLFLKPGEPLQALNHHAKPNVAVDCKRWRLIALRTIPIDVEMTIDYLAAELDDRCRSIRQAFMDQSPSAQAVANGPSEPSPAPRRAGPRRSKLFAPPASG